MMTTPRSAARTYRPKTGWFVFAGLFAVGAVALGIGCLLQPVPHGGPMILAVIPCALSLCFAIAPLWAVAVDRITLDGDTIEARQLGYGTRRAHRPQIRGFRTFAIHGITTLVLELDAGKPIKIGIVHALDSTFDAWMSGIPNNDVLDYQRSMAELMADRTIAASAGELTAKLESAHRLALGMNLSAAGLLLWALFYPRPQAVIATLATVLPLIPMAALHFQPGLFAIDGKPGQDAKPILLPSLIVPGAVLLLRGVCDYTHLEVLRLCVVGMIVAVAMGALTAVVSRTTSKRLVAFLILFFAAYGWGVAVHANAMLDRSQPATFDVAVLDRGPVARIRTRGSIRIAPWGPIDAPGWHSVPVAAFDATEVGRAVPVTLHEGALGVRWFTVGVAE